MLESGLIFSITITPLKKMTPQKKETATPLIRIAIEIDNNPLVSKKILRPKIMYSLKIKLKIIGWLEKFPTLRFIFISTCPQRAIFYL